MVNLRSLARRFTSAFAEPSFPADLAGEIATTRDGRDITRPWVQELEQPRDRRLLGVADWGIYERVRRDDQVKSCMQQRISAVVSRDWDVIPGDDKDPRSIAAAEALKDNLQAIGWDRRTEKMLWAPFYGFAVAELCWAPHNGLIGWSAIKVRHARRFRFDQDGRLRLLTIANMSGEILPDRKFWTVTAGGTDDDTTYGEGLAEALYWPTWFKRNGVGFWNTFLDKFAVPTAKGTYPRGSTQKDIDKLLAALKAIANDAGFVVPEGMAVELLQLAQRGADFETLCRYMDGAIAKIVLSQTMTTDNGSSKAQGQVHADVKLEVVKADADLLSDSFNAGPARWFTDLNFGADVASPIVVRIVEEEDDLKEAAETDEILSRIGWRRTEESFKDRYGDGYERAEPSRSANPGDGAAPGVDRNADPEPEPTAFAAADPQPLYVYRRVLNADEIIAWARSQGFASTVPASDMHVTIAYSRAPVNWFAMAADFVPGADLTVQPGGPRLVDRLGDQGAVVLLFANGDLAWRNRSMREKGASWDFPDYHPHVTLTYAANGVDLSKVQPYRGRIVLGPEIFEAIDEDWTDGLREVSLAEAAPAQPRDIVDDAVDQIMADEGWWTAITDPLLEQLRKAKSRDEALQILTREAELGDDQSMTEALARAGFALRIDALTDDTEEG
ncbi:MAG TPA: DUF935 family protein [Sphingomonas sp.]|nr:DUF935 family protein [Sphingomonas sp.]